MLLCATWHVDTGLALSSFRPEMRVEALPEPADPARLAFAQGRELGGRIRFDSGFTIMNTGAPMISTRPETFQRDRCRAGLTKATLSRPVL